MQTKLIFYKEGVALSFARNVRDFGTRKWPKGTGRSWFPSTTSGMSAYSHVWFTYYRMLIHRGSWCTWWNRFGVLHPSTLNPTWDLNPDHVRNKVTADVCIVGFHIKDDPLIHSTIKPRKTGFAKDLRVKPWEKKAKSKCLKCSHKRKIKKKPLAPTYSKTRNLV